MKRRNFITGSTAFGLLTPWALAQEKKLHHELGAGDLHSSLRCFNLHGQKPPEIQTLLERAYRFLEQSPARTFAELAQDAEFQGLCEKAGLTHLGGPMLGCISEMGAVVWIRTLRPASVAVVVNGKTFGPVQSTNVSDLMAIVRVTGLRPDSENAYRVLVDGKPVKTEGATVIRTTTESPAVTRIAFGSCWHRWGLSNPMMDLVSSRRPRAMLMIGDIAVQDRWGHLGKARFDFMMRDQQPVWQRFCSEIPVYANWDDHDYADNDMAGVAPGKFSAEDRSHVRDLFMQSWVNPQYGLEADRQGIFLRTRIGPADVIMTDNRYFRDRAKVPNAFLGKEQMDWLKQQLLASCAPFIILSCGTMWSDYVSSGKDSWGRFDPEGREEIFRFIEEHKIGGVLLISGDRHGARGFTLPRQGGFKFYEFGGASCGGRKGPPATDPAWTTQLYGISGEYAFSEFEFDTTKDDPEVTLRLIRENGKEIYLTTLKRSQLIAS